MEDKDKNFKKEDFIKKKDLKKALLSIAKEGYYKKRKFYNLSDERKSNKGLKEKIYEKYTGWSRKEKTCKINDKGKRFLDSLYKEIKNTFHFQKSDIRIIHKVPPGKRKLPPVNKEIVRKILGEKKDELQIYYRIIAPPKIKDYIVQKAIFNKLNSEFSKIFSKNSFAYVHKNCHREFNTSSAIKKVEKLLKKYQYGCNCDIKKYFDSIPHEKLRESIKSFLNQIETFSKSEKTRIFYFFDEYLKSIEETYKEFFPRRKKQGEFSWDILYPVCWQIFILTL